MTDSQEQLLPTLNLDDLRKIAEQDLYVFTKAILKFSWLEKKIHLPLCRVLQGPHVLSSEQTNEFIRKLLFVLPRGWFKTTICTIAYPIWRAIKNPNLRILIVQNNMNNARKKLKVIREQFEMNALLRALYPHLLPTSNCVWSGESACLNRTESYAESTFECLGVGGQAVSRHYNVIIEDDIIAPEFDELGEECLPPTSDDVAKAINYHRIITPLLDDPPINLPGRITPELLHVGTRWYVNDVIEWILNNEPSFKVVTRACREDNQGNPSPSGHITYPERFNEDVLRERENALGPYMFSCLYLNSPVRTGDMLFQKDWIQYYEVLPPTRSMVTWTTIDAATDPELSKSTKLDYSVVMTCAKDLVTGNVFVLEYFRSRCSPGTHAAAVFEHVDRYNPIEVGYEDVAYQKSIDYWLKELMRQQGKFFILRPISRSGRSAVSKQTHIRGLQPIFAAKTIFIRPHMKELEGELLMFPHGAHDDLIDALAMQTQMWLSTRSTQEKPPDDDLNNPYSFAAAIATIENRLHKPGIVFDPMNTARTRAI